MLAVLQVAIKIHVFWFQVKMFFFSSLIPIYIYIYISRVRVTGYGLEMTIGSDLNLWITRAVS